MPWDEVMSKFKRRTLRSGGKGKSHPKVRTKSQALAIMLSEKAKAHSNIEYASKKLRRK